MKKIILLVLGCGTALALKYAAPSTVNVTISNQTPRIVEVYDRFGTTLVGPKKVVSVALSTYGPATFTAQYAPVPTAQKPVSTIDAAQMRYNEAGEIVQPVYNLYGPYGTVSDVLEGDKYVVRGDGSTKLIVKRG